MNIGIGWIWNHKVEAQLYSSEEEMVDGMRAVENLLLMTPTKNSSCLVTRTQVHCVYLIFL